MKIVFLSRHQNTTERGAEVFVKELAQRLSKNHQVDILSGTDADSVSKILAGKYDVVIPINGRLQSLKVSLARLMGGYKVLITGHSGKGWDDIWNIVIGRPDVFVALTEDMASWARKWAWGSKVIKISNGIDLEKFSPLGEKIQLNLPKPIVLSAGALVWYKHHEKVINAISQMQQGSLLIVGKGPMYENLKQMAENKLPGRFKIMEASNKDMPKVYRSVDLFTLPSWDREAFGLVYLEALASGLGVVAPNDKSRKEIIADAGVLVNTENPVEYIEGLKKALSSDWKKKSRQQAEKFSWDKVAKEYEQEMLRILKK